MKRQSRLAKSGATREFAQTWERKRAVERGDDLARAIRLTIESNRNVPVLLRPSHDVVPGRNSLTRRYAIDAVAIFPRNH